MSIFQKIIDKQISAKIVYEDHACLAFHDVNPQAPVHVLLIPKLVVKSLAELNEQHRELAGHLMLKAAEIAKTLGLDAQGYRVVTNIGNHGGQSVNHLHFHILGGRPLGWPPG